MHRATIQRIELCTVALLLFSGEVARASGLDRGARLCLQSLDLPIANAAADPRTVDLQTRLIRALEAAGFTLPDPAAVDAVVEREVKSAEGVVDPYTGRWDRDRYAARVVAFSKALQAELQCEARMAAEVRPVYAHFHQEVAYWDHTKERVSSGGRVALNALGGVTEWGFVPALSLWLRVFDLEGEEIAFRSAGIETLVHFAVIKDRDLLPADRWLTNAEKIDSAIRSALGPGGSSLRLHGNPARMPPSP